MFFEETWFSLAQVSGADSLLDMHSAFPLSLSLSCLECTSFSAPCGRGVRRRPESSTSIREIHMSLRVLSEGFSWGDVESRFVLNSVRFCFECFWVVWLEARRKDQVLEGRVTQCVIRHVRQQNLTIISLYKKLEGKSNHVLLCRRHWATLCTLSFNPFTHKLFKSIKVSKLYGFFEYLKLHVIHILNFFRNAT